VLFDVLLDLTSEDTVVLLQTDRWRFDDKGFWYLAGLLIGDLNNGAVIYGRMR
jgi:hypothetical protein